MRKGSIILGSIFACILASIMFAGHARAEVTGVESVMNGLITQQQINQTQTPQFSGRNGASESIDPVTGSFDWKTDVIQLSGKDGLDLNIGVLFQSNQAFSHLQHYGASASTKKYNYLISRYDLGEGWSFRFPSLQMEEGYTYYHNGEGPVYRVDFDATDSIESYTHLLGYQGKDLHFEKDTQGVFSNTQESSAYYLEHASKKREYFAADGRLLGIVDRYGNKIVFKHQDRQVYDGKTYKVISSITDTVGRTVTFTYADSPLGTHNPSFTGDKIEVAVSDPSGNQGQAITFSKNRKELLYDGGTADGYSPVLSYIDNHVMPKTSFVYNRGQARFDYSKKSYDSSSSEKNYLILNEIVYPGSKTIYQYEKVSRNLGVSGLVEEFRIKSRFDQIYQSGYEGDYNHSNYTYSGDYSGYPTYYDPNNLPDSYRFSSTSTAQSTTKTNGLAIISLFSGKGKPLSTETRAANGEKKITTYRAFHSTFKNLPTIIEEAQYAAGDTEASANKLYIAKQYTDTGALQSETSPLTQAQLNDASVKIKHTTTYTYEPNFSHLLSTSWYQNQSDASPLTESYTYSSKGRLKSFTNAAGEVTTYCYDTLDANGTVISDCSNAGAPLTDKVQKIYESKSLGNGKTARVVTSYSSDTGYAYPSEVATTFNTLNDSGQTISQTVTNKMTYYMTSGLLKATTDGNNNKTTYTYDALGRKKDVQYPTFTNLNGEKYESKDIFEYISTATTISYDAQNANITGLMVRSYRQYKQLSNQAVTSLNHTFDYYDGLGNLRISEYVQNALQKGTQYHYDDLSRATQAIDAMSNTTTVSFDEWGRQNEGFDANGNLYVTEYKLKDRRTVNYFVEAANIAAYRASPTVNSLKSSYVEQIADQWGRIVTNRVYKDWPNQAQPVVETYTYDLRGNVLSYTDPQHNVNAHGVTKLYSYDKLNRLSSLKDALGQQTNYSYDALGNILQVSMQSTSGAAPVVLNTKQYTEVGGLAQMTDPSGLSDSYRYDQLGLLKQRIDRNGITYTKQYDEQNRNTISTVSLNTNTYESKLNVGSNGILFDTEATYQNGAQTGSMQTEIDNLKRVKSVLIQSSNYSSNISLSYDLNSRMTQQANMTSGFYVNYQYKKQQLDKVQMDGLSSVNSADSSNVKYAYYANGQVKSITFPALTGGALLQTSYTYDTFNRVKTVVNKKGATQLSSYTYDYDNNGNIVKAIETNSQAMQTTSYAYDGLNRLINVTGENGLAIAYTYDVKGNRQTVRDTRLETTYTGGSNTYDLLNRLTSVSNGNGTTNFAYGPNNLRYKKTNGSQTVQYQYNTRGEVISETDGSNTVTANYVRGDRLLVKQDKTTGKSYYYLYNGHGDVVQMVDTEGNVVNEYQYDVWGTATPIKETVPNSFKYAGEMYDGETGLYYLRARYYDPAIGRFISEDAYEGQIHNPLSLNMYTYVYNNPLNYKDPSGHMGVALLRSFLAVHAIVRHYTNVEIARGIFAANGEGSIYTAFHEIAQVHAATQIYNNNKASNPAVPEQAQQHLLPTLEYKVETNEKKWTGKCCKSYEADIVYGDQVWEVKPLGGQSPKRQLDTYTKDGTLRRGDQLDTMDVGIIDYGDTYNITVQLRMNIESPADGEIYYSFYLLMGDEKVNVTTSQAREIVDDYYFDDDSFKFKKWKKK